MLCPDVKGRSSRLAVDTCFAGLPTNVIRATNDRIKHEQVFCE
jgi:hypothetical protein